MFYSPLLVLKGIHQYWKYYFFASKLKQMEAYLSLTSILTFCLAYWFMCAKQLGVPSTRQPKNTASICFPKILGFGFCSFLVGLSDLHCSWIKFSFWVWVLFIFSRGLQKTRLFCSNPKVVKLLLSYRPQEADGPETSDYRSAQQVQNAFVLTLSTLAVIAQRTITRCLPVQSVPLNIARGRGSFP